MKIETILNAIEILKYCIQNKCNGSIASVYFDKDSSYLRKVILRIKNSYDEISILYPNELQEYTLLFNEYENSKYFNGRINNNVSNNTTTTNVTNINTVDLVAEAEYEERSKCWEERDENTGNILLYKYLIYVRDKEPIKGELTREQIETIYQNYPYVTRNNVSQYFPYLDFITFKRILRLFNITKDQLFPKHILEEYSEEQIAEFALKAKEKSGYKKFIQNQSSFLEKSLREAQKELYDIKKNRNWLKEQLIDLFNDTDLTTKVRLPYSEYIFNSDDIINELEEPKALFIYISDQHIGAANSVYSLYKNEYNEDEYINRVNKILEEIKTNIYADNYDKIIIINLGDSLDGYNGTTTRGGHTLEQNLNNKEQFKVYIHSMLYFFEEIYKFINENGINNINKIEYHCVGNDNHAGEFGYTANYALKLILELKYEDLYFNLFEKNIQHFYYGEHCFIITHGKDQKFMFKNMPLTLNPDVETKIQMYIKANNITSKYISVVKGDLHQSSTQRGKFFRYKNVGSLFGSSEYIMENFGNTKACFNYDIVYKNKDKIFETYIEVN